MITLWRCSLNIFVFLLFRWCFLITPIKCLKGYKSLGSLIAFSVRRTDGHWTLVGIIRQRQHFVNFYQGAAEKKNRISPFCWLGWVDLLPCVKHIYCFLRDKRVLSLCPVSQKEFQICSHQRTQRSQMMKRQMKSYNFFQDLTWLELTWYDPT